MVRSELKLLLVCCRRMAKRKHALFTRGCKDLFRYIKDGLLSDLCNVLHNL